MRAANNVTTVCLGTVKTTQDLGSVPRLAARAR